MDDLDDPNLEELTNYVQQLIGSAVAKGLLKPPANVSGNFLDQLARMGLLMKVLPVCNSAMKMSGAVPGNSWEFDDAIGPLVRLAVFEIAYGLGWAEIRTLFKHYLGDEIDPLMPSVFLAAVASQSLTPSPELLQDACRLFDGLYPGGTIFDSLRDGDDWD